MPRENGISKKFILLAVELLCHISNRCASLWCLGTPGVKESIFFFKNLFINKLLHLISGNIGYTLLGHILFYPVYFHYGFALIFCTPTSPADLEVKITNLELLVEIFKDLNLGYTLMGFVDTQIPAQDIVRNSQPPSTHTYTLLRASDL